ncbi:protease [Pedobacter sp. MC2016-14]|uniref:protease n=1 Tax=Pedobacter sp. MC2016-14 TaxID=2897327 RepID=UPI001E2D162B|nr:protease [Pedobacter sp. MC2016-14]MCD0490107.1 protease [Pedobacter sp. MC2016-14]
MKNYQLLLAASILVAFASCSPNTTSTDNNSVNADSVSTQAEEKLLYAKMNIKADIKQGDSVLLKFTVYNPADTAMQFCKWHTPFEPLISKYLDITDENGNEVAYQGAMAKRVMPPPADSYLKVQPGDSLAVTVDVLKGYAITKPATYTLKYSGQNMSGLIVKDSVVFVYGK